MPTSSARPKTSHAVQVEVFFRDGWLCSHCRRPTIFPPALKLLSEAVSREFPARSLAYWNPQWRRDAAPLLDELAACVDHVDAYVKGGAHNIANFATICARCNARKGTRSREEHLKMAPRWVVKGKHGEPTHWDGLSTVFVLFTRQTSRTLTATETSWLRALESYQNAHDQTT